VFNLAEIGKKLLKTDLNIIAHIPAILEMQRVLGSITIAMLKCYIEVPEDDWYVEVGDELLMMFSTLAESFQYFSPAEIQLMMNDSNVREFISLLNGVAAEISTFYVDVRTHTAVSDSEEDFDEKDAILFEDQLISIAMLARLNPEPVLKKLLECLNEKRAQLALILMNPSNETHAHAFALQEHIHWAVLIIGHILADSDEGEEPTIFHTLLAIAV
jgi:hypothetical protein